jgi:hypothetical protein
LRDFLKLILKFASISKTKGFDITARFLQTLDSAVKFALGCDGAGMKNFEPSTHGAVRGTTGRMLPEVRRETAGTLQIDSKYNNKNNLNREVAHTTPARRCPANDRISPVTRPSKWQHLRFQMTTRNSFDDTAVRFQAVGANPSLQSQYGGQRIFHRDIFLEEKP